MSSRLLPRPVREVPFSMVMRTRVERYDRISPETGIDEVRKNRGTQIEPTVDRGDGTKSVAELRNQRCIHVITT